jgi:hypothetical protein
MILFLGEAGLCWIEGSGVQVLLLASLWFEERCRCAAVGAVEWAKVLSHESFGVLPKHHMHQRLIVWIILCNQSH